MSSSRWSQEDLAVVKAAVRTCPVADVADLFGVSVSAIRSLCKARGWRIKGRARPWTKREDARLRALFGRAEAAAIGRELGRSASGVWARGQKLGLARRNRRPGRGEAWEVELRRLNAEGWTDSEIARHLGCGREQLSEFRRAFGLPNNGLGPRRRAQVAAKTREQLAAAGCASLAELKGRVVRARARALGWPDDLRERAVQMLEALYQHGPMTREQLAAAVRMRWKGTRASLHSNDREGPYLAHLMSRGLVVRLGRLVRRAGRGKSVHVYSLALDVEKRPAAG